MPTSHGLLVILSMSVLPPEAKKPQKQTWWQNKHVKHDVYDTQQPMLPAAIKECSLLLPLFMCLPQVNCKISLKISLFAWVFFCVFGSIGFALHVMVWEMHATMNKAETLRLCLRAFICVFGLSISLRDPVQTLLTEHSRSPPWSLNNWLCTILSSQDHTAVSFTQPQPKSPLQSPKTHKCLCVTLADACCLPLLPYFQNLIAPTLCRTSYHWTKEQKIALIWVYIALFPNHTQLPSSADQ